MQLSIIAVNRGIGFLGFRMFNHHKLLKKSNLGKITRKLAMLKTKFNDGKTSYDEIHSSFEGWLTYAKQGNTHKLRARIIKKFESLFANRIAAVEICGWLKLKSRKA